MRAVGSDDPPASNVRAMRGLPVFPTSISAEIQAVRLLVCHRGMLTAVELVSSPVLVEDSTLPCSRLAAMASESPPWRFVLLWDWALTLAQEWGSASSARCSTIDYYEQERQNTGEAAGDAPAVSA